MRRVAACFVFLSLFSLVLVTSAVAQSTEHTLFVSVLDKDNSPVVGLGMDAFTVREDGQPREVLRASRAVQPVDVALLVDNSQAITPHVNDIRQAVSAFTQRMAKDGNPIALIGLADRPTILQDYIASPEALERASKKIFAQPGAGTTALDAIIETSRGLQKRDAARRVIVVLTTEGTDFSNPNYRHALDVLKESSAALYGVVLTEPGNNVAVNTEEGRNRAIVLADGSDSSGGRLIHVISSMSFTDTLAGVAATIEQQYEIVYSRPAALIPPDKIEVRVNRPDATARATPAAEPPRPRAGQ
jgi:VWFA-related protein